MDYISYNGKLRFSRELTEEEVDELIDILDFDGDDPTFDISGDEIGISAPMCYDDGYDVMCKSLPHWCKDHDVKLLPDSYIKYGGDAEGAFYPNPDGEMANHEIGDYYIWSATNEQLINELKRRGAWLEVKKEETYGI